MEGREEQRETEAGHVTVVLAPLTRMKTSIVKIFERKHKGKEEGGGRGETQREQDQWKKKKTYSKKQTKTKNRGSRGE